MCTTDLCNANDYNFHTERANRLFRKQPQSEAVRSPFFPPTTGSSASSSRNSQVTIVTPSSNLVEAEEVDAVKVHERDQERIETLWTDKFEDLLGKPKALNYFKIKIMSKMCVIIIFY